MSDIRFFAKSKETDFLDSYRTVLQEYINIFFEAIGESDSGITWYICKDDDLPDYPKKTDIYKIADFPIDFMTNLQYGRCNVIDRKIWISTSAIDTAPDVGLIKDKENRKIIRHIILLVDVIMDEFTHIKTQAGHGELNYENQIREYRKKFWGRDKL